MILRPTSVHCVDTTNFSHNSKSQKVPHPDFAWSADVYWKLLFISLLISASHWQIISLIDLSKYIIAKYLVAKVIPAHVPSELAFNWLLLIIKNFFNLISFQRFCYKESRLPKLSSLIVVIDLEKIESQVPILER